MPEQPMPQQQAPQQQMSPEQIKDLQEKIKQMSPEELKEFQKKQCIFCQIIAGKVQSRRVYEDDHVIAILDVNPANPGHILVMPREHYSIMPQIPDEEIGHIFMVTKALSNSSTAGIKVSGTKIPPNSPNLSFILITPPKFFDFCIRIICSPKSSANQYTIYSC